MTTGWASLSVAAKIGPASRAEDGMPNRNAQRKLGTARGRLGAHAKRSLPYRRHAAKSDVSASGADRVD
jgi:hypothetical protein